ncbi:MAG: AAA family ATPase, partial [Bacteroidetes bacterium]|nr:AAA family ATPase [Bacteroidota bacterium]
MLITFSVGNYKVFKEIVTLDMRGASISKPTDAHIIDAGKLKLLKSVAIYGPNASGKSKLLEAMQFMQDFVINSSKNTQSNEDINVDSFRLSTETRDKPS